MTCVSSEPPRRQTGQRPLRRAGVRLLGIGLVLLVAGQSATRGQTITLNLSRDLVGLGIAATNLAPNQPVLDAGPLLVSGLEYARSHGVTRVIVDPGAYYFLSRQFTGIHVVAYAIHGITIDCQGSNLYFGNPQTAGLAIWESTGATVQNCSMDFLDLPFTQVTVRAVDPTTRQLQFEVPAGWANPTSFNTRRNTSGHDEPVHVFIFRDGSPAAGVSRLTAARPLGTNVFTFANDGLPWETNAVLSRIRPGDTAVLTPRATSGAPLFAYHDDRLTVRNIRIYSSGSVGFAGQRLSNSLIERVYVMPRPGTDRLISTNADGILLGQAGPGNVVRLSRAIRTLDDGFSPHSLVYGNVVSRIDSRTVKMQRQYSNVFPRNGTAVALQEIAQGAILGTAVIVSQTPPPEADPTFEGLVDVTFDRDVPALPAGTVFYATDPSERGDGLLLDRVTVQDQVFARGITLWGVMRATLRGSYIRNAHMAGVFVPHRVNRIDWRSPPIDGLTIDRNVIDATVTNFGSTPAEKMAAIELLAQREDFQPMAGSPHRGAVVSNNFIADSSRSAIRLQNVAGGTITGNRIVNTSMSPDMDGYWEDTDPTYRAEFRTPVVMRSSTGISESGNVLSQNTPRLALTATTGRSLVAYAPDSDVLLQGPGIATFAQVALVDAEGTRHTLVVTPERPDAIRVRLAATAALGGAYIEVANGSLTAYATLFIDDRDNFEIQGTSLGVPATVTATQEGTGLRVSWLPPAGGPAPAGYSLEFRSGASVVAAADVGSGTSFTAAFPAGTRGTFSVALRALLGQRTGAWGLPLPFTIGGEPGVPSNVQVLVVGPTLRVTWSPPATGATPTGYRLDFRTGSAVLASIAVGAATTFETPIPAGLAGAFTVTVTALTGTTAGAATAPVGFTIGAPPGTPMNLLGLANGTFLALSWTNSATLPAASGLRLDVTGSLSTSLVLPVGESFTFAGVPPGTYTFTLSAFNQSGASAPSGPVTLTFPAQCSGSPQAPLAFAAARDGRTVSASWDAPASGPAVTGYVLLVDGALSTTVSTPTRSLAGAVGPGTYTLRVAAANACGTGAPTSPVTIVVP